MNDKYIIPDLVPHGVDYNRLLGSKDECDETNRLLVLNLGWFALRISRIIREAHDAFSRDGVLSDAVEKAMSDMEDLKKGLREVGFFSDAHRDVWYPAYLYLIDARCRSGATEMDLQRHIRNNLSAYVDGALIPIRPKDYEGLCDLLISVGGKERPMEVKLQKFDRKAKLQLRRYMEFYGADIGYAAAPTLTTDLDPDMIFIDVSGWNVQH